MDVLAVSQKREISEQMGRATGGYELAVSPLLLGLIGFGLDHLFGTTPLLTVLFAVVGLAGVVTKIYFQYRAEMEAHAENGPWSRR
ncbi:MAG: AtpZ/AtpI family protein [Acidobacteria bacterium]|nr:AtpZ/AtpI family protein [Acidobacteriota bacterium]